MIWFLESWTYGDLVLPSLQYNIQYHSNEVSANFYPQIRVCKTPQQPIGARLFRQQRSDAMARNDDGSGELLVAGRNIPYFIRSIGLSEQGSAHSIPQRKRVIRNAQRCVYCRDHKLAPRSVDTGNINSFHPRVLGDVYVAGRPAV